MDLIISQQLAQQIMDYLVQQPYNRVANLVTKLQQLQPAGASMGDAGKLEEIAKAAEHKNGKDGAGSQKQGEKSA